VLPELLLVALIGLLIWYGVARALRPLLDLQAEVSSRSHRDLSPLQVQNAPGELRALVGAMNGLLSSLSIALAAQQRFIADAAHQLRTPLAGLRTQTELALRQNDPEEVRKTLRQIDTATARTTHLVNQLLALARAEPGANQLSAAQRIDLTELALTTTTEWVPQAIERDIDLGFEGATTAVGINGDPILLKELLGNLIDNAIRYTPPGGQVTVAVTSALHNCLLSVEDNGPGIPAEERERVFGLAIVREIAYGHGATVALEEAVGGHGTRVSVAFPALKENPQVTVTQEPA